jgi:hypothetical protein
LERGTEERIGGTVVPRELGHRHQQISIAPALLTTVLVYNGGTEQRGPQNVNGGHTLMARETVRAIALKLGNAITAPVLPFSVNEASSDLPGTIGLTGPLFAAINERVAEQLITCGFRNVVFVVRRFARLADRISNGSLEQFLAHPSFVAPEVEHFAAGSNFRPMNPGARPGLPSEPWQYATAQVLR